MKRVLESEPDLTRYYVTLPIDLPAGDTKTRSSAQTRWDEKVVGWRALAAQRGMTVEFVLLGAHELVSALTLPANEGRARYWFGADVLTDQWRRRRLEEAVTKAGRRYTPDVHVEVHTVQALHAVGRSAPHVDRWCVALAALREARRWGWRSPRDQAVFESALARCGEALTAADASLATMIAALGSSDDLPALDQDLSEALASVAEVEDLLRQYCLTEGRYHVDDAATLSARELADNPQTRAAGTKRLVITGRAGTGQDPPVLRRRVATTRRRPVDPAAARTGFRHAEPALAVRRDHTARRPGRGRDRLLRTRGGGIRAPRADDDRCAQRERPARTLARRSPSTAGRCEPLRKHRGGGVVPSSSTPSWARRSDRRSSTRGSRRRRTGRSAGTPRSTDSSRRPFLSWVLSSATRCSSS